MTRSDIESLEFERGAVERWAPLSRRNTNWPVVYVIDDSRASARRSSTGLRSVYVGESVNVAKRMQQHLSNPEKAHLDTVRVIVDETFNKSACLDLESFLIRLLSGDGSFQVLNRNDGILDTDYYDRCRYQEHFRDVFDRLAADGVFTRTIPQIENSDLFKLSPFKALTQDQAIAVDDILSGLFADLEAGNAGTTVVSGQPGTGKTVVAIYLLKLLVDIAAARESNDEVDRDSLFSDYFVEGYPQLIDPDKLGIVVPQQSLRQSIRKVFRRTPGLSADMVLTPFEVGSSDKHFDLLIVDESHRLNQRANQASGPLNKKFAEITEQLFGSDDTSKTQLDWIIAKSRHQLLFLDSAQGVRPADLPIEVLNELERSAKERHRHYPLQTQMRVKAGDDYVGHIRGLLRADARSTSAIPAEVKRFEGYDLRLFTDVRKMRDEIVRMEEAHGLARTVAGYAWPWKSKKDSAAHDIEIEGLRLRWNSTATDWIASPNSIDEVGSIHTVQGYDLNYAGVIIGADLRYDPVQEELFVDRSSYFDKKGMENNPKLGRIYTDEDLLRFITNIYAVLLTRGIRGTFVYVCDPGLREYLARFIPTA